MRRRFFVLITTVSMMISSVTCYANPAVALQASQMLMNSTAAQTQYDAAIAAVYPPNIQNVVAGNMLLASEQQQAALIAQAAAIQDQRQAMALKVAAAAQAQAQVQAKTQTQSQQQKESSKQQSSSSSAANGSGDNTSSNNENRGQSSYPKSVRGNDGKGDTWEVKWIDENTVQTNTVTGTTVTCKRGENYLIPTNEDREKRFHKTNRPNCASPNGEYRTVKVEQVVEQYRPCAKCW